MFVCKFKVSTAQCISDLLLACIFHYSHDCYTHTKETLHSGQKSYFERQHSNFQRFFKKLWTPDNLQRTQNAQNETILFEKVDGQSLIEGRINEPLKIRVDIQK